MRDNVVDFLGVDGGGKHSVCSDSTHADSAHKYDPDSRIRFFSAGKCLYPTGQQLLSLLWDEGDPDFQSSTNIIFKFPHSSIVSISILRWRVLSGQCRGVTFIAGSV